MARQSCQVKTYVPGPEDWQRTPYLVKDLSRGSQMALWSIRKWVACRLRGVDCRDVLTQPYELAGMDNGVGHLDESLQLLAALSLRQVNIECACCAQLSSDELFLLKTIRALSSGQHDLAVRYASRFMQAGTAKPFCRTVELYVADLTGAGLDMKLTPPKLAFSQG